MKKETRNILIIAGIIFVLFFTVGAHFINKYYHQKVKSNPKMYCYEYFRGTEKPVSVLFIEDLDLKDSYLKYYRELKRGKEPYLPNQMSLKGMPQYDPVYLIGYSKDSLLAEVVSYYDRGARFGGSYAKGWVLTECLHKQPPLKK